MRPPLQLWFNWRLEGVEKVPPEGPLIVAGNHLSYLDPLAHAYFLDRAGRRARFLAKQELFDVPLVGAALRGAGHIPVARGSGDPASLEDARCALDDGEVVVIYPEGTTRTTSPDFSPGPGRTGVVRLALSTGVPVLPVATWGGQWVWRTSGHERPAFGRPIWVVAGDPIDVVARAAVTPESASVRALTDGLMDELARLVTDVRARYPRRWSPGGPGGSRSERGRASGSPPTDG